MKVGHCANVVLSIVAAASLAACGGATGGGDVASGGTGGTGISYGSVSGFGSVIVNGVRFNTSNATVTVNGQPGPDETTDPYRGLAVGMVVKVDGSFDPTGTTGTATQVTYSHNVKGPIDQLVPIDASTRQATVLGQTVIMDGQTRFEGTTLADLAVGNVVEVSGFVDDQGRIRATYVETKADAFASFEVKGTITGLNAGAKSFQIGSLTVDYASAAIDVPGGVLANGLFVEVNGSSFGPGGELIATEVELEVEGIGDHNADEAEIEGFVTAVNGPSSFVIGNQPFVTTATTVFKGGLVTDVAVGVKLEVEGRFVNGVLTAEEVEFRDSIKLESAVATVPGDGSLTLKGLPGITVRWNELTRVEGFASASAIAANDLVKIRARVSGEELIATEIEKGEPDPDGVEVELQGPVEAIERPVLVILGVRVDTSGARFFGADERTVTEQQFFDALSVDDLAEVEGKLQPDGTVLWKEAELED